jgi:hypothetical protein
MSKEAKMLTEFRYDDNVKSCVIHHIFSKIKTKDIHEINEMAQPALFCICTACMFQFQKKNLRRYAITIDGVFLHSGKRAAESVRFRRNAKSNTWNLFKRKQQGDVYPFQLDNRVTVNDQVKRRSLRRHHRNLAEPVKRLNWTVDTAMAMERKSINWGNIGSIASRTYDLYKFSKRTGIAITGSMDTALRNIQRFDYQLEISKTWSTRSTYETSSKIGRILQRERPKNRLFDAHLMGLKSYVLDAVYMWNDAGRPSAKKSSSESSFIKISDYLVDLKDVLSYYRGVTKKKWGPESMFDMAEIGLDSYALAPKFLQVK